METREVLLKADKVSVVFERLADGKIRATASSWDEAKVILPHQVLEVAVIASTQSGARRKPGRLNHEPTGSAARAQPGSIAQRKPPKSNCSIFNSCDNLEVLTQD